MWLLEHQETSEAGEGTRTPNLLITNQLLYQLSYASTENEKANAANDPVNAGYYRLSEEPAAN